LLPRNDTPERMFTRPINGFVAGSVGSPATHPIPSTVVAEDGRIRLVGADGWRPEVSPANARNALGAGFEGVVAGIRHGAVRLHREGVAGAVPGRLCARAPTGDVTCVHDALRPSATLVVSARPGTRPRPTSASGSSRVGYGCTSATGGPSG